MVSGLNGYRVGLKQEDGTIFEFITIWAKNKTAALSDAKETALAVGDPVDRITVRRITDKDEIIQSLKEHITFMNEDCCNEYIGDVFVDSGQLIISDPCLLDNWEPGEYVAGSMAIENSYDEACKVTSSKDGCGQVLRGFALALETGYGDGQYSVYAKKDKQGRIVKVEIDLSEN